MQRILQPVVNGGIVSRLLGAKGIQRARRARSHTGFGQACERLESRNLLSAALAAELINLDDFRAAYPGIDGQGYAIAIVELHGFHTAHPVFGLDSDSDGVADRIRYTEDLIDGDTDVSAPVGSPHGTQVAAVAASSNSAFYGVAPGAELILIRSSSVQEGAELVAQIASDETNPVYNLNGEVVAVNFSLSAGVLTDQEVTSSVLAGRLSDLRSDDVLPVVAAGNDFDGEKIVREAATAGAVAVSAVYNLGHADADEIVEAYNRGPLTHILAPGAEIGGAPLGDGGYIPPASVINGSSYAAPFITGLVPLMQQFAKQYLGTELSVDQFEQLMTESATQIHDSTLGIDLPRIDVMAMASAVLDLQSAGSTDYGDAPVSYGTRLADNGARHTNSGPRLGLLRDAESDANAGLGADGDDNIGLDDEDGIIFKTPLQAGTTATIEVQVSDDAILDAWIDFNGNEVFDANERIYGAEIEGPGKNFDFFVPADAQGIASSNETFARFRLSTAGGLEPVGAASDGEVEDYRVVITPADAAIYDFDSASYSVAEGDSTITSFVTRVTRTGNTTIPTSVDVVLTGVTADAGIDFASGPVSIDFDAGQSIANVPIQLFGDEFPEPDETIMLEFANFQPTGAAGAVNPTATFTIRNDDDGVGDVSGTVWLDLNNNQIIDAGEPGIPGQQVLFDLDGDGQQDAGELLAMSGTDGTYSQANVPAGNYIVTHLLPAGWEHRYPTVGSDEVKLVADDAAAGDRFGFSVDVSGNFMVIGSPFDDTTDTNAGAAYVFENTGGGWIQTQKILGSDSGRGDEFGYDVAISGQTIVVGARRHDGGSADTGAAYVFEYGGSDWSETAKLQDTVDPGFARLGTSVDIDGNVIVAGAPDKFVSGADRAGAAFVFTKAAGSWSETIKLLGGDSADNDDFGKAVAIDGQTIVVGAPEHDAVGDNGGAAYVFFNAGSNWGFQEKLEAGTGVADDRFGSAVAVEGDTVVVGAPRGFVDGSGRAFIYVRFGSNWTEESEVAASDASDLDHFGSRVAIDDGRVAVAAEFSDSAGTDFGAVYLFEESGGNWTENLIISASDGATFDDFNAVSIDNGNLVVGGSLNDDAGNASGSTYVRIIPPPAPGTHHVTVLDQSDLSLDFGSHPVGGVDFGDAADPTFPTLLTSTGASHAIPGSADSVLRLGSLIDAEPDGQQTPDAAGDDQDGTDDDDGILVGGQSIDVVPLVTGEVAEVQVIVNGAGGGSPLLQGWIDYNGDGDWNDAAEQVFTNVSLVDGVNALPLAVPASAVAGSVNARFRLSTEVNLSLDGFAVDGEVEDYLLTIESPPPAAITARHLFYNNSRYDDPTLGIGDPDINADDDLAIAVDKSALVPGTMATFANYSGYSRGINGIMIDIANPAGIPVESDFEFRVGNSQDVGSWGDAPEYNGFAVRESDSSPGTYRATFTWPDGAIRSQWLQVTVLASENTGLAIADVHYWGNQVGETGNGSTTSVDGADVGIVVNNPSGFTPAEIDNPYDVNKSGFVDGGDVGLVVNSPSGFTSLLLFEPPLEDPPDNALDDGAESADTAEEPVRNSVVELSRPDPEITATFETGTLSAGAATEVAELRDVAVSASTAAVTGREAKPVVESGITGTEGSVETSTEREPAATDGGSQSNDFSDEVPGRRFSLYAALTRWRLRRMENKEQSKSAAENDRDQQQRDRNHSKQRPAASIVAVDRGQLVKSDQIATGLLSYFSIREKQRMKVTLMEDPDTVEQSTLRRLLRRRS